MTASSTSLTPLQPVTSEVTVEECEYGPDGKLLKRTVRTTRTTTPPVVPPVVQPVPYQPYQPYRPYRPYDRCYPWYTGPVWQSPSDHTITINGIADPKCVANAVPKYLG